MGVPVASVVFFVSCLDFHLYLRLSHVTQLGIRGGVRYIIVIVLASIPLRQMTPICCVVESSRNIFVVTRLLILDKGNIVSWMFSCKGRCLNWGRRIQYF